MRVGVVGCGFICHEHLRVLRRLRDVEIVGVCDRQPELAASVAKAYGAPRAFDDPSRFLAEARPDVVHVLTPPQSHRELAAQALQAGCHVLVEKPMATSVDDAQAMLRTARDTGRHLGVCHNFRFVPAFLRAQQVLESGALGSLLSAEVYWRMSSHGPEKRAQAQQWMHALPGGVFHEVLPHLLYTLGAVMGRLRLVSAVSDAATRDDPSELRALFLTPSGPAALGLSLQSTPVQKFVRVYGSRASLHIDLATSALIRLRAPADSIVTRAWANLDQSAQLAAGTLANAVKMIVGRLPRGHETLLRRFYERLRRGEPPPVSADEGLATVAALEDLCNALGSETQQRG
ncbi:MAG TPA: Gfo/Idh/MocA family oxidoreductase [Gammaproteobacteria bacterium]|nr:Gfo/Idh/MocA family oxidoreductase [Gammaproteobacteria bacterium]